METEAAMMFAISKMFSGICSDELDRMGHRSQVVSGFVLNQGHLKCYGEVRTLKLETMETPDENIRTGLGFLESMKSGQVLCVEASNEFAYFGELMTRLSVRQGLGGVVIGGLTRDSVFTKSICDLPIFAKGYSPKDIKGRGRVDAVDIPVLIEGVSVLPGDWIFGDNDGIVVIPAKLKIEVETRVQQAINDEMDIISRIDAGESIKQILGFHEAF